MNNFSTQKLPKRLWGLTELAYNMWWSWHPEARELFKVLDRPLWKATGHNPVRLLEQLPPYRLVAAAEDQEFLRRYDAVINQFRGEMADSNTWFAATHPDIKNSLVAYFSMEFAIHNSIPIYAGGLGILAGDYCKEASDLGVPIIGIGFMYPQGYFAQHIADDGWQHENYDRLDFSRSPVIQVVDDNRRPIKTVVDFESRKVTVAVWQVNVGRIKLYLLDTDSADNNPADRQLSARLYAGDSEFRLQQELILGIGGVRVLRQLGIAPTIWHANEGHSAFMTLERIRELMVEGKSFKQAQLAVQATTIFTTHTPVPAGNDVFDPGLIEKYFRNYWVDLGLTKETFLELGTLRSTSDKFNMTVFGMRICCQRNGVSRLHGNVCRKMWNCIWPETGEEYVPIISITNGVHVPTWVSPQMARLFEGYLGKDWLEKHDDPSIWELVDDIPNSEIWAVRRWLKNKLINHAKERARQRWSKDQGSPQQALAMGALLDPDVLTLGFSRRFTDYKRAGLIFNDVERLKRMLFNELRPLQIIFAGKAHPNDHNGKCIIQRIYNIAKDPQFNGRIAFMEDYDMHKARYLVHGVNIWLNTPRPLQEASGTSGMKAAINGVPHLSVLDGWWYEAYNGTNGWAIHTDIESTDAIDPDKTDAGELYQLLENEIIPLYYDRDIEGVPNGWINVVKRTIRSDVPFFSARRMVKEYTERMYVKAAITSENISDKVVASRS